MRLIDDPTWQQILAVLPQQDRETVYPLVPDDVWGIVTLAGEADDQAYNTKIGVSEVIHTRAATKYMCNGTIPSACLRWEQFSCWNPGAPPLDFMALVDDTDHSGRECRAAWQQPVFPGHVPIVGGANSYFDSSIAPPAWATPDKFVIQLQKLSFYKL
jgi:hypothetical protein